MEPVLLTDMYRSALLFCLLSLNGCTVIAIADAAVSTTVKVGSAVVGTAVDVTRAGVRAITPGTSDSADDDGSDATAVNTASDTDAGNNPDSNDDRDNDDVSSHHRKQQQ